MTKPLRQSVSIPIGKSSISVEVTFRILEIVERVYDIRADYVKLALQLDKYIKRTDVSNVLLGWLEVVGEKIDREEVFETVMTCEEATLRKYVGAIQGAIMYSLKECTEEELQQLADGKDIRTEADDGKKKNESS